MSEDDYQRGLRGGPARVSTSDDWDRWQDWKAGHDEYERMQEEEDEARFAEVSTPEETTARVLAAIAVREKANEEKLARMYEAERYYAENERKRKAEASSSGCVVFIGVLCLIGGLVAGVIGST